LEASRDARADPHRVERDQIHELVVELNAAGPGEDDVNLLRGAVAMDGRLALPGLHDEEVHPRMLGAQPWKASLLNR